MQRRNLFDVLPPVDLNGGNDFGDGGNDFGACAQHDRVVATVGGGVVEEVAVLRTHPFGMAVGDRLEQEARCRYGEPLFVNSARAQHRSLPDVKQRVRRRSTP